MLNSLELSASVSSMLPSTPLAPAANTPVPALTPSMLISNAEQLGVELAQKSRQRDECGRPALEVYEQIRDLRLGAIRVPTQYGGAGGSHHDLAQIIIALARGDSSVAQAMLPHFVFVERTLLMATPTQVAHYMSLVAHGTLVGGASAERGGKFRGEVRTTLRRQGQHYVLQGSKQYCTGALMGDLVKVMAVDEDGRSVQAVISAQREGVQLHDDWDAIGQRGTASGTSEFVNVVVQPEEIIAAYEWQNRRHHTGSTSQLIHCAIDVGIALAALDDAIDWGRHGGLRPLKESGVERAQDDPFLLHMIGEMAAQTHTAQALVLQAAQVIDVAAKARLQVTPELDENAIQELAVQAAIATAQAKVSSTQAALRTAESLFDVGGASMTLRRNGFDRHWRNIRTHSTHDPVVYKLKAVGNFLLNEVPPPISYTY